MEDSMDMEEQGTAEEFLIGSGLIRRVQSYDPGEDESDSFENAYDSPLHVSFDTSQLTAFKDIEHPQEDIHNSSINNSGIALDGRLHFNGSSSTARKQIHSRNYLDIFATNKTPSRRLLRTKQRVGNNSNTNIAMATQKKTPASARRHRLYTRRSPMRANSAASATKKSTTPILMRSFSGPTPVAPPLYDISQQAPSSNSQPPFVWSDGSLDITPAEGASKKPSKRSIGTVTTVASSTILETTAETEDSTDTNDAPFRFTSFPASLPRINNLGDNPRSTGTVRKRMNPLGEEGPLGTSQEQHASMDDMDEMSTSPIGTPVGRRRLNFNSVLSPAVGRGGVGTPLRMGTSSPLPGTPKEVKLHFQSGLGQCSPIRGIPEEDGDLISSRSSSSEKTDARRSLSGESSITTISSGKGTRPMPDLNAFEGDSADKSHEKSHSSHPPSPKLLCPPTPVRTPAWVHGDVGTLGPKPKKFGRQNSLIATKVLATCSQRDLDDRTSLENSLLEEESGGKPENNHSSLSCSTSNTLESVFEASLERGRLSLPESWLQDRREPLFEDTHDEPLGANEVVSMAASFDILGVLGKGTFADVYKVHSKTDGKLYAVKKHRRQFRGRRDRDMALAEVRHMQRLQHTEIGDGAKSNFCLYLLFFYKAWQEDGHFFCQTELCCRDTCREFMDSLRLNWTVCRDKYPCLKRLPAPLGISAGTDQDIIGRMVPEPTIWKICHDLSAGLSHIHSHGLVHHDIKPSNIFLVAHSHGGAMCKIGDFGMAGDIGTSEDGQEGDQKYMAPELLSSDVKHPSADMFSLGLTLYELASSLSFEVPAEGQLWHDLRSGKDIPALPSCRDRDLVYLIRHLMNPDRHQRPTANWVLSNRKVSLSGSSRDGLLASYIIDVEDFDQRNDEKIKMVEVDEQTPTVPGRPRLCVSPSLVLPTMPPTLFPSPKVSATPPCNV